MSERTITVSNGEDFYRIPVSDVADACADGFYVPALNGNTIVTDGTELFEIPTDDLAEAESDGFRDALIAERDLLPQVRTLLGIATDDGTKTIVAEAAVAETEDDYEYEYACDDSSAETLSATATIAPGDTLLMAPPTAKAVAAKPKEPAKVIAAAELPVAEEPEEERSGIARYLLPGGHIGGQNTWQVMLVNIGLHGLIVLFLALIILPTPEFEVFMEITSAIEPKDPVEMDFEAVELEQPKELETDPVEVEVANQFDVESPNNVEIDISDVELSIPDMPILTDSKTGPQTTNSKSEMGGRSKAGRAAAVAKRGGNSASEAAVTKGLLWLALHQYPDGGWSYDHSLGECKGQCSQPGSLQADCRNAATGMALLAMLGAGQTPYNGDFQKEVQQGVAFLLKNSAPVGAGLDVRGQFSGNTGMYTQAIAATALCEILAMTKHEFDDAKFDKEMQRDNSKRFALMKQLRPPAEAAIAFILNAQHKPTGGWGYSPGTAGDTSILGWQIMALKSAVHAGIPIPGSNIIAANQFLTSVQTEDGWFGYNSPQKKASTTAIGMISRMLSGMDREHPQLRMGIANLSATGPAFNNMYYNYYATQVMMHYGGEEWQKWNSVMRDHLVKTQVQEGHAAGSWNIAGGHGAVAGRLYMTCLCTMTLEVYYRHLPLYGDPEVAETDTRAEKDTKE